MDRHTICRRILMRFQFAFVLCSLLCGGLSYADSNVVETAIGKLFVSHDRKFSYSQGDNAFDVEKLYQEFESIYQNQISQLPIEDRLGLISERQCDQNEILYREIGFTKLLKVKIIWV